MRHRELRGDGAARFGSPEISPAYARQVDAGRAAAPHSGATRTRRGERYYVAISESVILGRGLDDILTIDDIPI
jgi:hypothetical protein